MVFVGIAILVVLIAWVFFAQSKKQPLAQRKKKKKSAISKTKASKAAAFENDYLEFDFKQSGAVLAVTQPAEPADGEVKKQYQEHLDKIPALPLVWPELLRAIEGGEPARKIAQLIKNEPTLAVQVLRHANALALKDINDLGQAIVLLGYNAVQGIVTKYCIGGLASTGKTPYQSKVLWKHAIATSALANICATYIPGCNMGFASTLGLLHDLGRIGINVSLKKRQQIKADLELGYLHFEREIFGISHVEAGLLLAKHWHLPAAIQEGISFHHHPAFAEPDVIPEHIRKEVLAVYIADLLAIHFKLEGGHHLVTLPKPAYGALMNASIQEIAADPRVNKELWRVKVINF